MANTLKPATQLDHQQADKYAYNDVNATYGVDGFLVGLVGRKVTFAVSTTNVAGDTQIITFSENGVDLYTLTLIYTDATQATLLSAERTA